MSFNSQRSYKASKKPSSRWDIMLDSKLLAASISTNNNVKPQAQTFIDVSIGMGNGYSSHLQVEVTSS